MFVWSSFVAIDVFLKSFIIISSYHQRHVASEMGFKQDSPNTNPDSDPLIGYSFFTESRFGFTMYPNPDSLIEYPLSKYKKNKGKKQETQQKLYNICWLTAKTHDIKTQTNMHHKLEHKRNYNIT